eukprot:5464109-Prymnesium_polylepis.1
MGEGVLGHGLRERASATSRSARVGPTPGVQMDVSNDPPGAGRTNTHAPTLRTHTTISCSDNWASSAPEHSPPCARCLLPAAAVPSIVPLRCDVSVRYTSAADHHNPRLSPVRVSPSA